MQDQGTLAKFGTEFQTKCIIALLNDRAFMEQTSDVVDPAFFEGSANHWIVEKIFWYFNAYRAIPSIHVFKKEVDKINDDVMKSNIIQHLKSIYEKNTQYANDLAYVKDEFLTFCKNQALKNAVIKSAELLDRGEYSTIKSVIDKALHAGEERNLGHVYLEDGESRWNKLSRNTVATPWECINQLTDGGLGAGELGTIIAPSGIGKSWFLCALGAAALKQGKKVAHYTFELSQDYVGLRYDTIFTGIEPNKIPLNLDKVKEAMGQINGQLFIKYYPTRSVNITSIRAHIQRLQMLGNGPDLLIIDYADLMRALSKSDARHEELGYIHEEIRGMLGELGIPGWTASQSQRSSLQDDIVEADKIAGSYAKIMANDVVISASRKTSDKVTNTGRVHVIKNRFGADGLTFPAHLDLTHGVIDIFDENSPQGIVIKNKMMSGDGAIKQLLKKKMIDPSNTPNN